MVGPIGDIQGPHESINDVKLPVLGLTYPIDRIIYERIWTKFCTVWIFLEPFPPVPRGKLWKSDYPPFEMQPSLLV